ncbi:helix-hairpin-helix domain-containing protein [Kushneria phosphatilytica]|nr:endonuclease/exonuclease/phosphatase family protein [Kushneria phosphatilytica]
MTRVRSAATGLTLAATIALTGPVAADMTIGSWNLQHLGWDNGKQLDRVAQIAQGADLWALEEVMNSDAVTQLEHQLEQQTGEQWSSMTSHEVGRSSYQESYAYLWRDSVVEYTKGAAVYMDPGDEFAREPYLAEFRDKDDGQTVAMAAVHIVYGDSRSDRTPEVRELASIWQWMSEVYPDTPRIITGDFNLSPDNAAWQPLREQGAQPAITSGASTLSETDGQYAHLYDNFWYDSTALDVTGNGIVQYPKLLGITNEEGRSTVSDHAPIYLTIGDAKPGFSSSETSGDSSGSAADCIDLNSSSAERLDVLPNIGPARAQDIIDGRPWQSVSDLTRIDGIGPARMREIQSTGEVCSI